MAEEVILPRVDMDMAEGKVAHWHVRNGDPVRRGQVIFEIETDKATMEIEATADGILAGSDGATDVVLPVGHVLAWILQPGEALPQGGAAPSAPAEVGAALDAPGREDTPMQPAAEGSNLPVARNDRAGPTLLRATPLARSIARMQGLDLHTVQGSGPDGRILARDLQGAGTASAQPLHLHWFRRGVGAPLVLLHGFATSSGSWRALAQQLGDVPVLGIDLPNHGKSPRLAVPDLDAVARMLLQRLDQEGVTVLHLLGHSMGGGAALALLPALHRRLRSLTLLAPLGLGPQIDGAFIQGIVRASRPESLRPWLSTLFGDPAQLSGSFAATAWSELEAPDTRAALAAMADRLLPDGTQATLLRQRLGDLGVPVKLLWGTLDAIVPCAQAAGLPGTVALHLLPGVGHLPHIEATALVAQLVRQQLAAGHALAAPDAPRAAPGSAPFA